MYPCIYVFMCVYVCMHHQYLTASGGTFGPGKKPRQRQGQGRTSTEVRYSSERERERQPSQRSVQLPIYMSLQFIVCMMVLSARRNRS